MKRFEGSVKVFVIINTTSYASNGKYAVTTANLGEMKELGFDDNDINNILNKMDVDNIETFDIGCYVMRIA
jgi:hypothetical protein